MNVIPKNLIIRIKVFLSFSLLFPLDTHILSDPRAKPNLLSDPRAKPNLAFFLSIHPSFFRASKFFPQDPSFFLSCFKIFLWFAPDLKMVALRGGIQFIVANLAGIERRHTVYCLQILPALRGGIQFIVCKSRWHWEEAYSLLLQISPSFSRATIHPSFFPASKFFPQDPSFFLSCFKIFLWFASDLKMVALRGGIQFIVDALSMKNPILLPHCKLNNPR